MSITIDGTTGISGNNGSASTPAIQGEDTNTGVFFPAADTVAVATGGTERMRVVNGFFGGYVGINTTTPSAALNVASIGTSNVPTATGAVMRIEQGPTGYSETVLQIAAGDQSYGWGAILFGVGALANSSRIASFGSGDSNGLLIQENSGGPITLSTSGGQAVRITSAGNVGIGTSVPSDYNAAADNLVVGTTSGNNGITIASGTANQGSLFFADGTATGAEEAAGYVIYEHTANYMAFGTQNTERARITAGGDFQFNSGYGSVSTVYGCRAWVNFNGTNGAIRASGGVSSVTYNGTGQSTVNFSTAMPDVNYSAVCSGHSAGFNRQSNAMPASSGYATGSVVIIYGNTINGAAENLSHVNVAVFR